MYQQGRTVRSKVEWEQPPRSARISPHPSGTVNFASAVRFRFILKLLDRISRPNSRTLWLVHTTDRFRQRGTGLPEYTFDRGGSRRIPNSLKEWNAKGSYAVTAIVQNRKRNVDYTLYLIAFSLVKSALFNLGQVLVQIAESARSIVFAPELYSPRRNF